MNRKFVNTLFLTVLMTVLMFSASVARADSLSITFNPVSQTGAPGDTLSFSGIISAPLSNSGTVNLVGADINISPAFPPPSSFDLTPFFNNAPFTMAPGDMTNNIGLFTVMIPFVNQGTYFGTFDINDGVNSIPLGTGRFEVVVTPEPASMILLGTGLSGLAGIIRRKRK